MRIVRSMALGAALGFMPGLAGAETITNGRAVDPNSVVGQFFYSDEALNEISNLAHGADRDLGLACQGKYTLGEVRLFILAPVEFPAGAGTPVSGAWSYRFDVNRCGATKRYNLMASAKAGQPNKYSVLAPGNTLASPLLTGDTFKSAMFQASLTAGKDCQDMKLFETELTTPPQMIKTEGKQVMSGWRERWTLLACGKPVGMNIDFTPDGKGGTHFNISN